MGCQHSFGYSFPGNDKAEEQTIWDEVAAFTDNVEVIVGEDKMVYVNFDLYCSHAYVKEIKEAMLSILKKYGAPNSKAEFWYEVISVQSETIEI
jgi:hypothetical protein